MENNSFESDVEQIYNILENKKIIVKEAETVDQVFYVSLPSSSVLHISATIYNKKFKEATDDGLQTEEELLFHLDKNGLFTKADQERIDKLSKTISDYDLLLRKLGKTDKTEKYRSLYLKKRQEAQDELQLISSRRQNLLCNSAEHHANAAKMQFMLPFCCFSLDGKRYWSIYDEFQNQQNSIMISFFLGPFVEFFNRCMQYDVRRLSRNFDWRSKWRIACKTGTPIIGRPVTDWTPIQLQLAMWSNFYDNIYESYDCPPDWLIENDEELDKWLEERSKKADNDRYKRFSEEGSSVSHNASGSTGKQDVMIFENKERYFPEFVEKSEIRKFNMLNEKLGLDIKQDILTGEVING